MQALLTGLGACRKAFLHWYTGEGMDEMEVSLVSPLIMQSWPRRPTSFLGQ